MLIAQNSHCLTPTGNRLLLFGFSLLGLMITCLTGCGSKLSAPPIPQPSVSGDTVAFQTNSSQLGALTIETASVQQGTSIPFSGRLLWDESATVRVFSPFAGIVRKLLVGVGETAGKGASLAAIQSSDFGQALAEARKAESDFRRTDLNLNRVRDLTTHGAVPRKDLEAAEAEFANARAEKDRAETRLAIYGSATNGSDQDFLLPSPLAGVVVERNVTPGQEVRPDQMLANTPQLTLPLFVITDPLRLWIQIDATEIDLPHLRSGRQFTFTTRALPGHTFTGRVDAVSEFIDPVTRTIRVRGSAANPERLLKAEMLVAVRFPANETDAITTVPTKAVFLKGEKHYAFVETRPGEFARREVTAGTEQNGRIVVLSGLQPGQRVVTDGCILLQQMLKP